MKKFLFVLSLLLVSYTEGKEIPKEKITPVVQEKILDSLKLGKKYLNENNLEKAEKYLQIAAKGDNTEAQYILGIVYTRKNDIKSAEKYYKIAADSGDIKSQRELGNLYYFNLGKYDLAEKYLMYMII